MPLDNDIIVPAVDIKWSGGSVADSVRMSDTQPDRAPVGMPRREVERIFRGHLSGHEEQVADRAPDRGAFLRETALAAYLSHRMDVPVKAVSSNLDAYTGLWFGEGLDTDEAYREILEAYQYEDRLSDPVPDPEATEEDETWAPIKWADGVLADTVADPDEAYNDIFVQTAEAGAHGAGEGYDNVQRSVLRGTARLVYDTAAGVANRLHLDETAARISDWSRQVEDYLAADPEMQKAIDEVSGSWRQLRSSDWWATRGAELLPNVPFFLSGYMAMTKASGMLAAKYLPAAGRAIPWIQRGATATGMAAAEGVTEEGGALSGIERHREQVRMTEEYLESLPDEEFEAMYHAGALDAMIAMRETWDVTQSRDQAAEAARGVFWDNMRVNTVLNALEFTGAGMAAKALRGSRGMVARGVAGGLASMLFEGEQELRQDVIQERAQIRALAAQAVEQDRIPVRVFRALLGKDGPEAFDTALAAMVLSSRSTVAEVLSDVGKARTMAKKEKILRRFREGLRSAVAQADAADAATEQEAQQQEQPEETVGEPPADAVTTRARELLDRLDQSESLAEWYGVLQEMAREDVDQVYDALEQERALDDVIGEMYDERVREQVDRLRAQEEAEIRALEDEQVETEEPDAIRAAVQDFAARLGPAESQLTIVDTVADLPSHVQTDRGVVEGAYDPNADRVYLVLENLQSREHAVRKYLHEMGGHRGLRVLLSPQVYDEVMDWVYALVGPGAIAKTLPAVYAGTSRRIQTEEYLARLAEKVLRGDGLGVQEQTIWQRIVAYVRRMIGRGDGRVEDITDPEVARLVRDAVAAGLETAGDAVASQGLRWSLADSAIRSYVEMYGKSDDQGAINDLRQAAEYIHSERAQVPYSLSDSSSDAPGAAGRRMGRDVSSVARRRRVAEAMRFQGGARARSIIQDELSRTGRASVLLRDLITREIPSFDIRGERIESPADFAAALMPLRSPMFESLKVLVMGTDNQVLRSQVLSVQTLDRATVHPRDLLAVVQDVDVPADQIAGVMIAHNHPTGDPRPSSQDIAFTDYIAAALGTAGYELLDHVITNGTRYANWQGEWQQQEIPQAHLAPWEGTALDDLPRLRGTGDLPNILAYVRSTSPVGHVLYLNTKNVVIGVERFPLGMDRHDMMTMVAQGVGRETPGKIMVDLGPGHGDVQVLRTIQMAADLVDVDVLDASDGDTESYLSKNLLQDDPGEYGPSDKVAAMQNAALLARETDEVQARADQGDDPDARRHARFGRSMTRLRDVQYSLIDSDVPVQDYREEGWNSVNNYMRTSTMVISRLLGLNVTQIGSPVYTRVVTLATDQRYANDTYPLVDDWLNEQSLSLTDEQRKRLFTNRRGKQRRTVTAREIQVELGIADPVRAKAADEKNAPRKLTLEYSATPQDLMRIVYDHRDRLFAYRDPEKTFGQVAEEYGFVPAGWGAELDKAAAGDRTSGRPVSQLREVAEAAGLVGDPAWALEDLYELRRDVDSDAPYLGDNGKTGKSLDFPIMTCHPSAPCQECYAAEAYARAAHNRRHIRNLIALLQDPKGMGRRVAEEAMTQPAQDLKFVRIFGAGDMTMTEMVDAFNELAQHLDRPIHIFSRHHHNLRKLKSGPNSTWRRMASVDAELFDVYGVEWLRENARLGIANAWLYTDESEISAMETLLDNDALGVVLAASHDLYEGLPEHLRMVNCPCDAGERSFALSCQICALSGQGCFVAFQTKAEAPDGRVIDLRHEIPQDGYRNLAALLPGDVMAGAWADSFKNLINRNIQSLQPQYQAFKKGKKDMLTLKDSRRLNSEGLTDALRTRLEKDRETGEWTVVVRRQWVSDSGRPKGEPVQEAVLWRGKRKAGGRSWAINNVIDPWFAHFRALRDHAIETGTMYFHGVNPEDGGIQAPIAMDEFHRVDPKDKGAIKELRQRTWDTFSPAKSQTGEQIRYSHPSRKPARDAAFQIALRVYREDFPSDAEIQDLLEPLGLLAEKDRILKRAEAIVRGMDRKVDEWRTDDQMMRALKEAEIRDYYARLVDDIYRHGMDRGEYVARAQERLAALRDRRDAQAIRARQGMGPEELKTFGLDAVAAIRQVLPDPDDKPKPKKEEAPEENDEDVVEDEEDAQELEIEVEDDQSQDEDDGGEGPPITTKDWEELRDRIRHTVRNKMVAEQELGRDDDYLHDPRFRRDVQLTWQRVLSAAARELGVSARRESLRLWIRDIADKAYMETTERHARRILDRINREWDRQDINDTLRKIDQLLKRKEAKGQESRTKELMHKDITPAARRWLRLVRGAYRMGDQTYEETLRKLQKWLNRNGYSDQEEKDFRADLERQFSVLRDPVYRAMETDDMALIVHMAVFHYGALRTRTPEDVRAAYEQLQADLQGGIDRLEEQQQARRERLQGCRNRLLYAATEGPATEHSSALEQKAERFATGAYSLRNRMLDLLRRASGRNRRRARDEVRRQTDLIQKANRRKETMARQAQVELAHALEAIYGMPAADAVRDLERPREAYREFSRGAGRPALSKGQLLQIVATWEQEEYRANLKANGRGEGYINAIYSHLTQQDLALLSWLRKWYDQQRAVISEVSERVTGVPVVSPSDLYLPVAIYRPEFGLEEQHVVPIIVPRSLTPRVSHDHDLDESVSILGMWHDRQREMTQYVTHSELAIELRGIWATAEMRQAIEQSHGTEVARGLIGHLTDVATGQELGPRMGLLDEARGWVSMMSLAGNIGVMLRQPTSIFAFAHEIGLRDVARHLRTAFSEEGRAAMRTIWQSEGRKNRWSAGVDEGMENALRGDDAGRLKRAFRRAMVTNLVGDIVPTLLVGQGVFREMYAQAIRDGKTQEAAREWALDRMWGVAERTQQSHAIKDLAEWQRRWGTPGRALAQFTSTVRQYADYEVLAIREYRARPTQTNRRRLMNTLIINHLLLPGLYQVVRLAWAQVLGDDWEEDDWWQIVASVITGPAAGFVVFGSMAESIVSTALTGKVPFGGTSLPMAQLEDLAISPIQLLRHLTVDFALGKALKDLDDLASTMSPAYRDASRAAQNYLGEE